MSLKTIDYVIKEDYAHNNLPGTKLTRDLTEYFNLKQKYREFLMKSNQTKKIQTTINNSHDGSKFMTNYPLRFKEGNGKYIVEVYDDETREMMYSKTIHVEEHINVYSQIKLLKSELSKYNLSINKLTTQENINTIRRSSADNELLLENNVISKSEFEKTQSLIEENIKTLEEDYNLIRGVVSDLNLELNMLNTYLSNYIRDKFKHVNRLELDNVGILWESHKNLLADGLLDNLLNFHKLDRILHQDKNMYDGDLVYVHSNLLDEAEYSEDFIGMLSKTINESDDIEIKTDEGTSLTLSKNAISPIEGIYYQLKKGRLDSDIFTISKTKYYDKLEKIGINKGPVDTGIDIVNNTPDTKNILQKKNINYGFNKKPSGSAVKINIKKALKLKEEYIHPVNTFIDEETLYATDMDVLMYYSKSASKPKPGKGSHEVIKSDVNYDSLHIIKDWRKKLSNFWIGEKPINIMGKQFASVEHFFHFMKFWNNRGLEGEALDKYNEYALNFTFDCENHLCWGRSDASVAKQMGGEESGLRHRTEWNKPLETIIPNSNLDGYNRVSLRDYILVIGMYHKFTQDDELQKMLLSTEQALLLHPKGGNARSGVYSPEYPLMIVRRLIKEDKDINMKIVHAILDPSRIISLGPSTPESSTSLSPKSPTPLSPKSPTTPSPESSTSLSPESSTSLSPESSTSLSPKSPTAPSPKLSPLSLLKDKAAKSGIDTSQLSPKSIESAVEKHIIKESSSEYRKLTLEIENLQKVLDAKSKTIYEVPPNGDCGYYSVTEMMHLSNIFPLNFEGVQCADDLLCQYSSDKESTDVSITQEVRKTLILEKAMTEMRHDIALKFKDNILIGDEDDSESIKIAKESVYTANSEDAPGGNTSFNKIIRDNYYNKIYNTGSWISELELQLASALYNIDILIHLSNNRVNNINAAEMKLIFDKGKQYNTEKPTQKIELGYYSNFHYVGVHDRITQINLPEFNKLTYYKLDIVFKGNTYHLVIDIIDEDEIVPMGIYDASNNKIDYFSYADGSIDGDIVDLFEDNFEIESASDPLLEPIYYYQDIENNNIYIAPSASDDRVGHLVIKMSDDGTSNNKIIFE